MKYRYSNPKNFHPNTLCNIIYKIITKAISLCLKPFLPTFISSKQYGHVEGRRILDNIILSHKVIYSLKSTNAHSMLIKLDMSKQYGYVEGRRILDNIILSYKVILKYANVCSVLIKLDK